MRSGAIVILLATALGSGCVGDGDQQRAGGADEASRRVVFLCDGGSSMTVTFEGAVATLEAAGQRVQLAQQPSGSGIHYSGGGNDLRGKGPEATWTDATGVMRACRDQSWAMSQPQISEPKGGLAGTSWTLVHFQSSDDAVGTVVPPRSERYTVRFAPDGELTLQLDCNRAHGRWTAKPSSATGGALTLIGGAMTRAACGPGAIDTQIARDLARVRSYTLTGGRLSLSLEADSGVYLWVPGSAGG